ncbi:hypothetical protein FQA39_LY03323 [Lamprigera yunnana]|nr:hypothetical protein FQA39_LY03323 [Lamprigera yunnana]
MNDTAFESKELDGLFKPFQQITNTLNSNLFKELLQETEFQYIKEQIKIFEDHTNNFIKAREKLENQNNILSKDEKILQSTVERGLNSFALKKELQITMQEHLNGNQLDLNLFQEKCDATVAEYRDKYQELRKYHEDQVPAYKKLKGLETSNLKNEIEMKMLKKQRDDLKKQIKLKKDINNKLFNNKIVKFVQTIVDHQKNANLRSAVLCEKATGAKENVSKVRNNFSTNLFDLKSIVSTPTLPESSIFDINDYTYRDNTSLKVNTQLDQLKKHWRVNQSQSPLLRNRDFEKGNCNRILGKRPFPLNDDLLKNNKVKIINVQTVVPQTNIENVHLDQTKRTRDDHGVDPSEDNSNLRNQFLSKSQNTPANFNTTVKTMSPHDPPRAPLSDITKEATSIKSLNNKSKIDLVTSHFFQKPKVPVVALQQNKSITDSLHILNSSFAVEEDSSIIDDSYMHIMSPLNTSMDDNSHQGLKTDEPLQFTFNVGENNHNQANVVHSNPAASLFFANAASNTFNMFS